MKYICFACGKEITEKDMPMYDMIDKARPSLHDFCRKFFGHDGEFLAHCTDIDCHGLGGIDNYEFNGLPWVSFMYWQHYLYSMDQDFLRDRAYPLMREAARMMILELREWEDGYLHLPWTSSPEYHGPDETYRWVTHANPDWEHRFGPDATIDLSLLRFMCRTLLQITDILAVEDPDRKTWTHTLEHLVPYEKDRFGSYTVRKDLPITTTHRHQSHLFPIYPLHELTMEKEEDRKTMEDCLTVLGINGRGEWVGWTFPWVALLGAYSGRPAMARNVLLDYADRYVTESTVHYQARKGVVMYPFISPRPEISETPLRPVSNSLPQSRNSRFRAMEVRSACLRTLHRTGRTFVCTR